MRSMFVIAFVLAALPCTSHAQFTGHTVACDRRYPTDTQVPSKYGQQVIAAKGSYFLAGPCGIKVTGTQITITLSSLYNKYMFKNTTYNGYRMTVVDGTRGLSIVDWRLANSTATNHGQSRSLATTTQYDGTAGLSIFDFRLSSGISNAGASQSEIANRKSKMTSSTTISSVTVDPQTNWPGFDALRISFTSTYVQVNLAGLTFGLKDRVVLDVGFGNSRLSIVDCRTKSQIGNRKS